MEEQTIEKWRWIALGIILGIIITISLFIGLWYIPGVIVNGQ